MGHLDTALLRLALLEMIRPTAAPVPLVAEATPADAAWPPAARDKIRSLARMRRCLATARATAGAVPPAAEGALAAATAGLDRQLDGLVAFCAAHSGAALPEATVAASAPAAVGT